MRPLLIIGMIILTAAVFYQYFQNKKWEDLLENKQQSFNVKNKLKHKTSTNYRNALAGCMAALVCVTVMPSSWLSLTKEASSNDVLHGLTTDIGSVPNVNEDSEEALCPLCKIDEFAAEWDVAVCDNEEFAKYYVGEKVDVRLNEVIATLELDQNVKVNVGQTDGKMYVERVDNNTVYELLSRNY